MDVRWDRRIVRGRVSVYRRRAGLVVGRVRRVGASALAVGLLSSAVVAVGSPAVAADAVSGEKPAAVANVAARKAAPVVRPAAFVPDAVVWPSAGVAVADLAPQADGSRRGSVSVGGLPVRLSSVVSDVDARSGRGLAGAVSGRGTPARVRVQVLDRPSAVKAGVPVALRLSRADEAVGDARVHVEVDYRAFHDGFGGDWAHRLGLVLLPDCVVTDAGKRGCQSRKPLASSQDAASMTVSADVDLSAVVEEDTSPPLTDPDPTDAIVAPQNMASVDPYAGSFDTATPAPDPGQPGGEPVESNATTPTTATAGTDGVVVALTSSSSGETGDFGRTQLSQTASWQAGGPSGAFSWSYPIGVPPVPGGLTPPVAIDYSSASVDGQTANNNVQPSWIGEGFDFQPGYIERSYRPCYQDTEAATPYWPQTATMPDLCWRLPNAKLMWNGKASELIPDDASGSPNTATPSVWHLADDDGTKVEYVADSGSGLTGYWHDERWKLTTRDGTQYWFGMSAVPGLSPVVSTGSILGEAIMGNHAGEPCFSSAAFTQSWCRIAYRWNLDYVVDVHGNAMVYYYNRESNGQKIYNGSSTFVGYYRASTLARIDYGLRANSSTPAPARVVFTTSDRCWAADCAPNVNWPDVPWDLDCKAAPCDTPSFWTSKRLTKIETQVNTGGTSYRTVDAYDLDSTVMGTTHAGYTGVLNLTSITHTGKDSSTGVTGGDVALPAVVFGYGPATQNRAAFVAGTGAAESWKYRLIQVTDEAGGRIVVSYRALDPDCLDGNNAPNPDGNSDLCFPQLYAPQGQQAKWTWWHKYLVDSVVERDTTSAASPDVTHTYAYNSTLPNLRTAGGSIGSNTGVLWHHDMNAFGTLMVNRSWSQWAGYPIVTETVGSLGTVSKTVSLYFTGMDADITDTGSRTVTITDTDHGAAADVFYRAGQLKEQIVFDGANFVGKHFVDPTQMLTGTRTLSAAWAQSAPLTAFWTGTGWTEDATKVIASGVWRTARTNFTYDTTVGADGTYGNRLTESTLGDPATTADDLCTKTTYNTNAVVNLVRYDGSASGPLMGTSLADWSDFRSTFTPGDFDGDGKTDLMAVKASTGDLWLFRGNGAGGFDAGSAINPGWGIFDTVVSPGDFTNDGKPDIIARKASDGTLQLYRGNGTGGLTGPQQVGTGFGQFDLVFSVGDFASNGVGDLLVRQPDGDLYLYSGNGSGGWTNGNGGSLVGTGWNSFQPFGFRDYGYGSSTAADVIAQGPGGLWLYPGNGNGTFGSQFPLTNYGAVASNSGGFVAVGDITGDATKDILMRTQANLADTVAQTETYGQACTTAPTYPADGVAQTRYYYDQPGTASPSLTVRPWRAEVTRVDQVKDFTTGGTPNWITTGQTTAIDSYGRPTTVKDALGNTTTTAYTQTNGLTTSVLVTNPLGHQATTSVAAGRGLSVTAADPNANTTTGVYDALGRTLKVFKPGNQTGVPDTEYAYSLPGGTGTPTVTTKTMNPAETQTTSYEIYDGLLRLRQTQTPTADDNRAITDTRYDQRGLTTQTSVLLGSGPPTATLAAVTDTIATTQHRYTYDGLERQRTDQLWSNNTFQWTISDTSYGGDRTTVDNPTGATDTTTLIDFLGRTTELWQYQASTPSGAHTVAKYGYDHAGQLTTVTGPDGAVWTYTYDLLGRKTSTIDPDAGTSTTSYDDAGRITSTEDGRHQLLVFEYDNLGRKTDEYKTSKSAANQLAHWAYDTVPAGKGQLASATRYVGGNQVGGAAYTNSITEYDKGYRAKQVQLTIPAVEGALAGTYTTTYEYKTNGAPKTQSSTTKAGVTDVGGLPTETLTYDYNSIGQQTSFGPVGAPYLSSAAYTFDGQLAEQILGTGSTQVRHSFTYDPATRRALTSKVETGSGSTWANKAQDTYAYDQAGNITSIAGTSNGATDQVECFTYDYLRRLTAAWAEGSPPCDIGANQSAGVDPYRFAWTFDDTAPDGNGVIKTAGLRASETTYNTDGTVRSQSNYTYGGTNKPKHSLASVTTTGTGAGTKTYDYDLAGNTTSRPSPGGAQQTLTWDPEGHLAKATDSAETSFIYDADGNRLIRDEPGGYTTLTLTDGTELRANGSGSVAGTRYYGCATRTANTDASGNVTTGTTLTWNITDHHGTGSLAIDSATLQVDRRRSLPYGGPRGTQASGFGAKGFVNGTADPTGLTHLGAREYDPTTGRFISIDPLFALADPQSWNGYAYSSNNPITFSDPTGLKPIDPDLDDQFGREKPGTGKKKEWRPGSNPAPLTEDEAALLLHGMPYGQLPGGWSRHSVILLLQCVNDGNAKSCETLATAGEGAALVNNVLLELTGYTDAKACATQGSASGCIWTAAALIPFIGKGFKGLSLLFKGVRGIDQGSEVVNAVRTLADLKDAADATIPAGWTRSDWGELVWGRGPDAAAAARGLMGRTAADLAKIPNLTVETATKWRDMYQAAVDVGRGTGRGPSTAEARVDLMNDIIRTLGGTP